MHVVVNTSAPPPSGPKKPDSAWGMAGQVYSDMPVTAKKLAFWILAPFMVLAAIGYLFNIDMWSALRGKTDDDPDMVAKVQHLQGVMASSQTALNQFGAHLNTVENQFSALEEHQVLLGRWVCDKEGQRYGTCDYRYVRPQRYNQGPREVQGTAVTISPNTTVK